MCSKLKLSPQAGEVANAAVRDWLETQSRVTQYWRELLIARGGDDELIATLDLHADFLQAAAHQSVSRYRVPL